MNQGNLLARLPPAAAEEVFQELLQGGTFRMERIVSTGQRTPEGQWYDQEAAEWVLLVSGSATLRFEDQAEPCELRPGDWVDIPAHRRHRVERTDEHGPTVWLAVHYR
jgi:cupin 2 domain-containing protein